jgi:hypothetical protein
MLNHITFQCLFILSSIISIKYYLHSSNNLSHLYCTLPSIPVLYVYQHVAEVPQYSEQATGWMTGSIPGKVFLFTPTTRLALGPTKTPIQWALVTLSPGVNWLGHQAHTHLHLVLRLRMHGAILTPPYIFKVWCLIKSDVSSQHGIWLGTQAILPLTLQRVIGQTLT